MADRDQALAEFQTITGNENLVECIAILEQHDWNLLEAVQMALAVTDHDSLHSAQAFPLLGTGFQELPVMPQSVHSVAVNEAIVSQSISSLMSQRGPGLDILPGDIPAAAAAAASAVPSMSAFQPVPRGAESAFQPVPRGADSAFQPVPRGADVRPHRLLNFNIEYRDRNIELTLRDSESVGKLKQLLEQEITVPISKQELYGWVNKNDKRVMDEDRLYDLKLPKENSLFLLTPEVANPTIHKPNNGADASMMDRLSQIFNLKIVFKDKNQTFSLNFPGSKTVQEVKGDMFSLIDVPVSKQVWGGWPQHVDNDTMTLAGLGLGYPCHNLEVRSDKPAPPSSQANKPDDIDMDSDEDYEEAHDHFASDDNFLDMDVAGPRKPEPLMPENASDESEALQKFSAEFESRFGHCHPVFFIGTLEEALKTSLHCRARDRKLLAIYLHHDSSILANVFCAQILCAETVVSFLTNNFVIWAWDLTCEANKARLLTMCNRHFGNVAANTVRTIQPDELPLLLLISRIRGTNEVVSAIRGNTTLDELMLNLIHATEDFKEQQLSEIQEEDEREAREQVKTEQDVAYRESLATDRAKEEVKRQESEEKRQREAEESRKQKEADATKRRKEQKKEEERVSVANKLPEEPPANFSGSMATIRIRCPNSRNLVRRFLAQETLQTLLNYVTSEGYHVADYKVLTTFPRRDLTQMDKTASLEKLKLYPQETVILEEK